MLLGSAAYGVIPQRPAGDTTHSGSVAGTVFVDADVDGVRGSFERGEGNITVRAYDIAEEVVGTAVTRADGMYTLGVVDSASTAVRVEFDLSTGPAELRQSSGDHTDVQFVQLEATDVDLAVFRPNDFCRTMPAPCTAPIEFGDRVWLDANRDGLQTADEPPIANVTVWLLHGDTSHIDEAVTDPDGRYRFSSDTRFASTASHRFGLSALVPEGEVRIQIDLSDPDLPDRIRPTWGHRGGRSGTAADGIDSDVNHGIALSYPYFITGWGTVNHDLDAGLFTDPNDELGGEDDGGDIGPAMTTTTTAPSAPITVAPTTTTTTAPSAPITVAPTTTIAPTTTTSAPSISPVTVATTITIRPPT